MPSHIRAQNVMSRALTLLVACLAMASAELIRFDNYHVYRVTATSKDQLSVLRNLEGASEKIIFLDAVHYLNRSINVVVSPQEIEDFIQTLDGRGITHELLDEDAQKQLEGEDVAKASTRATVYNWEQYHELEDTYSWLESLVELYPKQVSLIEAGQTYEGRKILGIKISYKEGNTGIFLEGGMHAREWIGPATVTYITNQLLTSQDANVRMIAENFDWYIVPHANPDGFVYTHTTNRLWRKTRSPQGECFGADPNRNWGFHWNEVGASDNPCSDTYAGPEAFSEIETKSLSEYIATLKDKLLLYVSYHSYSQLLLFPYGHTGELPKNYGDLKRIFDVALEAVAERYKTKYTGGNIYDAIYPAAGASVDWAYGVAGVQLAYCFELRPPSSNFWTGFRLPAAQIIPTAEESLDSLVAMVKEAGINR